MKYKLPFIITFLIAINSGQGQEDSLKKDVNPHDSVKLSVPKTKTALNLFQQWSDSANGTVQKKQGSKHLHFNRNEESKKRYTVPKILFYILRTCILIFAFCFIIFGIIILKAMKKKRKVISSLPKQKMVIGKSIPLPKNETILICFNNSDSVSLGIK